MTRLIAYLLLMLALSAALAWISQHPGGLTLTWLDWRVDTSVAFLVGIVLFLAFVISGIFLLLRAVAVSPHIWKRRLRERSYVLGMQNITESLAALASGDVAEAHKFVTKAKRYIGEAPIILLLSAQVAKLEGDDKVTRELMEDMLDHSETRFLAARTLSEYHDRRHQSAQALTHAQEALRLKPRDEASLTAFISHAATLGRWQEALQVVHRTVLWLPRARRRRLEAMVYFMRAITLKQEGDITSALAFAHQSAKRLPEFAPAAALRAELTYEAHGTKDGIRAVKRAWPHAAHTELTRAFFSVTGTLAPEERLRAARGIAKSLPGHAESQLLLAFAAMRAKDWVTARAALMAALDLHETPRAFTLMAEVERDGFEDLAATAKWSLRAQGAGENAAWLCGACSHKEEKWHVHCPRCNAFDRMEWKTPVMRFAAAA